VINFGVREAFEERKEVDFGKKITLL